MFASTHIDADFNKALNAALIGELTVSTVKDLFENKQAEALKKRAAEVAQEKVRSAEKQARKATKKFEKLQKKMEKAARKVEQSVVETSAPSVQPTAAQKANEEEHDPRDHALNLDPEFKRLADDLVEQFRSGEISEHEFRKEVKEVILTGLACDPTTAEAAKEGYFDEIVTVLLEKMVSKAIEDGHLTGKAIQTPVSMEAGSSELRIHDIDGEEVPADPMADAAQSGTALGQAFAKANAPKGNARKSKK